MCGSHWFVNQLLLKAALLQFSPSTRPEVWASSHLALHTTVCWDKVVLIVHTPRCSQCLNHIVFWLLQSHGSQTGDDCLFCQSSNLIFISLLMPSCKHGPIARQFLQNTTGTPTKFFSENVLRFPAASLQSPSWTGESFSSISLLETHPQQSDTTHFSLNHCLCSSFSATIL